MFLDVNNMKVFIINKRKKYYCIETQDRFLCIQYLVAQYLKKTDIKAPDLQGRFKRYTFVYLSKQMESISVFEHCSQGIQKDNLVILL